MQRTLLSLSTALATGLGLPAIAQQAFDLDAVTFTANRSETALGRAGAAVSVLTRADIEASGATSVSDLIARLPGVSASATGPVGNLTSVRLRGLQPRFTAVLVDGVLVNDPSSSSGEVDFGAFLTADVDRIEVLRGAQSALYGGSAVAGVISITTTRAQQDGLRQRAEVMAGSYGTIKGSYGLTWRNGPVDGSFTLSHSSATGFSSSAGQPEPDGHSIQRISFGLNYQATDALRLGLSVFGQRAWTQYDNWPVDGAYDQDRNELGARAYAELALGRSTHLLELTGYHIARENRDSQPGRFEGTRLGMAYRGETMFSDAFTLQYGADIAQERAFGRTIPAGSFSTTTGAFVQALWAPTDRIDISASGRVDYNSTFGTFPTGRLAVSYRATDAITLNASAGTAFRAPSVEQRFGSSGGSFPFRGDPTLTPERATSFDVGADFALPRDGVFGVRLFQTSTDNLIVSTFCPYDAATFSCVAGTFNSVANVPGVSTSAGAELSLRLPINDRFALGGSYTYTNALQASGARVSRVPMHLATVTLDAKLSDRLNAGLTVKHVANRVDFRTDYTTGPVPDYTTLNLTARYSLTESADLVLRIDNLTDTQYQEVAGYGSTGRAFYVGLAARF
jgi:vitamin B12 transporter